MFCSCGRATGTGKAWRTFWSGLQAVILSEWFIFTPFLFSFRQHNQSSETVVLRFITPGVHKTENINRVKKSLDKLMKGRLMDLCFWREREWKDMSYPCLCDHYPAQPSLNKCRLGPIFRDGPTAFLTCFRSTAVQWGHGFYIYLGKLWLETLMCD